MIFNSSKPNESAEKSFENITQTFWSLSTTKTDKNCIIFFSVYLSIVMKDRFNCTQPLRNKAQALFFPHPNECSAWTNEIWWEPKWRQRKGPSEYLSHFHLPQAYDNKRTSFPFSSRNLLSTYLLIISGRDD